MAEQVTDEFDPLREKEFNLSSTIYNINGVECCQTEHIKEFIKIITKEWIKEHGVRARRDFMDFIKDRAGSKLS